MPGVDAEKAHNLCYEVRGPFGWTSAPSLAAWMTWPTARRIKFPNAPTRYYNVTYTPVTVSKPPKVQRRKSRFLIIINWSGERLEFWRHAKASTQAVHQAISALAKRIGYRNQYVKQTLDHAPHSVEVHQC